ncbi:hypothetical protein HMPREF2531_02468 [Bacteroides intestinalis]|uniref:Uncharacterized protein n=1 Tax=Bacteroides intestinalis TaxID=329854 RepID=A0A139LEU9_9BACE|nr:hypothetical protein HMPREF2531_02468 [Bacteroides intestinalis]
MSFSFCCQISCFAGKYTININFSTDCDFFYTSDPLFLGNIAPENNNTIYILMNYETQVDIIAGVVFPALGFQG